MSNSSQDDAFKESTLTDTYRAHHDHLRAERSVPSLGIVWHDDPARIGAVAPLRFGKTGSAELSRLAPVFAGQGDAPDLPILDRHVSRTPLHIQPDGVRKFKFIPAGNSVRVSINGRALTGPTSFDLDELGDDIIIELAHSVVLSLFYAPPKNLKGPGRDNFGLLGVSLGLSAARDSIRRVANSDLPVLIRGETGTGKELVARAVHKTSRRAGQAMTTINMAAIAPSLAAAELFGIKRGAFTGATHDRKGLFEKAHGGILFMDEIGDTPKEIQPMLLRALEFGEIRPVGDQNMQKVDVRVVAATDRQLEHQTHEPSFNQPLLRRLEGFSINLPPLRLRRVDIGILIQSFLVNALKTSLDIDLHRMKAPHIAQLALQPWPGNVRELKNSVQQIILGQPVLQDVQCQSVASSSFHVLPIVRPLRAAYKSAVEIGEPELLAALDEVNWVIKDAATYLGVSRTALYELMSKSIKIRHIDSISDAELRRVIETVPGGIKGWVKHLRVGKAALARKIRQLPTAHHDLDNEPA